MSGKISGMIWDMDLPHNECLILLAMADHADHNGEHIFPSMGLIAWKTGYSVRQIQRSVQGLVTKGILELVQVNGGPSGTNMYRVHPELAPQKAPYQGRMKLDPDQRRSLLWRLLDRTGPICAYCHGEGDDEVGPDGESWHIDRIIPGARGGRYVMENITLSCAYCNRSKNDRAAPRPRGKANATGQNVMPHDKMAHATGQNGTGGHDKMAPPDPGQNVVAPDIAMALTPDIAMAPDPSLTLEIDRKDEIDFFLIWDHQIGSPLSDGDRHMIAELQAAGLARDVWDAALRRAVQTRKPRVAGTPMPIAYVLKCITSIQAERDAAKDAVDRAFAPMVAPIADEPDDLRDEWAGVLDSLEVAPQDRTAWFAGTRLIEIVGDVGIVGVPNVFVRDEISLRFMSQLRAGLSRMSGRPMTVELVFS